MLFSGLHDSGVILFKAFSSLPQDKLFRDSLSFSFDFEYLGIGSLLFAHLECLYLSKIWEHRDWLLVFVLGQEEIEPTLVTNFMLLCHELTLIRLLLSFTALKFIILMEIVPLLGGDLSLDNLILVVHSIL